MSAMSRSKTRLLVVILAALVAALLPLLVSSYYVGLAVQICIFAIFAASLDILVGHTGLPSMGHAAYFGAAAYAAGFLYLAGIKSFWVTLVVGIGTAGATAALFGLLAMRAQGPYFMLISLALSQVLWGVAFKWRSVTRGDDGLPGIGRPLLGMGINLKPEVHFYYFVIVVALLVYMAIQVLIRSPFGHTLRGIRESESRMKALGYNVWFYKYMAFVLAGAFAGISGILWVYYSGYVNPTDLGIDLSVRGLLMLILGGSGSVFGPAVGSALIVLLQNVISGLTGRWSLVLGIIYVASVMLFSDGVFSIFRKRSKN
jgi:branched-chain amino acid transport system permease protein